MRIVRRHSETTAGTAAGMPHEFATDQRVHIAVLQARRKEVSQRLGSGQFWQPDPAGNSHELVANAVSPDRAGISPNNTRQRLHQYSL